MSVTSYASPTLTPPADAGRELFDATPGEVEHGIRWDMVERARQQIADDPGYADGDRLDAALDRLLDHLAD